MCTESAFIELREEVSTLSQRVESLEAVVAADSQAIERIDKHLDTLMRNTSELVQLHRDAKGAWRLLALVAKAAKPVLWIVATIGGLAIAIKTGDWSGK